MIPVYHMGRVVGWLPRIAVERDVPYLEFAVMPPLRLLSAPPSGDAMICPDSLERVTLRIEGRSAAGVPVKLIAHDLRHLLTLRGFLPEDWALKDLTAARGAH